MHKSLIRMNAFVVITIFGISSVGGCRRDNEARLIGVWKGSTNVDVARIGSNGLQHDDSRDGLHDTGEITLQIDFRDSQALTMDLRWEDSSAHNTVLTPRQGRWRLVDGDGDRFTVVCQADGQHAEIELDFVDVDRLKLTQIGGDYRVPSLFLTRQ